MMSQVGLVAAGGLRHGTGSRASRALGSTASGPHPCLFVHVYLKQRRRASPLTTRLGIECQPYYGGLLMSADGIIHTETLGLSHWSIQHERCRSLSKYAETGNEDRIHPKVEKLSQSPDRHSE